MITILQDTKKFIKQADEELYIYGCSNASMWTSYFLKKNDIKFKGFIDILAEENMYFEGMPVWSPKEISSFENDFYLIVLEEKWEAIEEMIEVYAKKINAFFLVPITKDYDNGYRKFDINGMLGYFRNRLYSGEIPTIITNSCDAGLIYHYMGMLSLFSPTINTYIRAGHFIKFCKNLDFYLGKKITYSGKTIVNKKVMPFGTLDDIEIVFSHADHGAEYEISGWNARKNLINHHNIIFIYDEAASDPVDVEYIKEFCNLPGKKLLLLQNSIYMGINSDDVIWTKVENFHDRKFVVENWINLVEWLAR